MPELARLVGEHVDEGLADRLALRLRIVEALEGCVEPLRRARDSQVEPEVLGEHLLDLLGLAVAKKPVVDEDAVKTRPYRPVEKDCRNGRVHAARKPEDHLVVADLGLHLLDRVVYPRRELPVGVRAADVEDEVREYLLAVLGMDDFRMELDAEEPPLLVAYRGERAVRGLGADLEPAWDRGNAVAVAHPDYELVGQPLEELVARLDRHLGLAVFAPLARLDLAAELLAHELHAVADAENRNAEIPYAAVDARRSVFEDAVRPAGEDDALRRVCANLFGGDAEGDDFGVDVLLANPARDQLGVLRTVVEYKYGVHDGVPPSAVTSPQSTTCACP